MNFKNWDQCKEYCKENNIFTKTWLKEKSLKPSKGSIAEEHKVYTGGRWKVFEFYKKCDTEPVRQRKSSIRELEINLDNICESLYIINKSAKKSRDTKQYNYYYRNFATVNRSKTRQNKLYELKNIVLNKLIVDGKLDLVGYHTQDNNDMKTYLIFYKYNNFSFHIIADKESVGDLEFLGNIENLISAEKTKDTKIKFNEAIRLLEKFIQ